MGCCDGEVCKIYKKSRWLQFNGCFVSISIISNLKDPGRTVLIKGLIDFVAVSCVQSVGEPPEEVKEGGWGILPLAYSTGRSGGSNQRLWLLTTELYNGQ